MFGNFFDFLAEFFGTFLEFLGKIFVNFFIGFFWRNVLEEFFCEKFLGEFFWVELFWRAYMCVKIFVLVKILSQGRRKEGQEFRSLEVRRKLIALKKSVGCRI